MVSGVPPPGAKPRAIYETPVYMPGSLRNAKPLLAANELIVVLGYSIIGKSVILLVNIN